MTDEPRSRPDAREPDSPPTPNQRQRPALVYLVILFAAAFVLLLFAYLMQQRNSAEILGNLSDLRNSMGNIQSIDQLVEENQTLREEKEDLESRITELEKQVSELEGELVTSQSMEDQWRDRKDTAEGITNAFDTLNRMHALYDQGRIEECRHTLEYLDRNRSEYMGEQESVEYYLTIWVGKFISMVDNEFLETYNPLEDWLALKAAILEAEAETEE